MTGFPVAIALAVTVSAAQSRGCVATPVHGQSVVVPASSASVPLSFAGVVDPAATRVIIESAQLRASTTGGTATTTGFTRLGIATPFLDTDGNTKFAINVNVPKARWPEDDVTAFIARQEVQGVRNLMTTINTAGVANNHFVIGVADRPDASNFPSLNAPTTQKFAGQTASTFLSRKGLPAPSNAYYNKIGAPTSFTAWKSKFGFPASNEVVTYYRNEYDLGFGREMHCRTIAVGAFGTSQRAACYVTNYRNENDAATGTQPIATVAMDYDVSRSDPVRYYVYSATGGLLNKVALDAGGEKAVPNLCLNCHGGSVGSDGKVQGTHFLPFDTPLLPTPSAKGAQKVEFQRQNAIVWSIERNNGQTPITNLIEGWYTRPDGTSGLFDTTTEFNPTFAPAGWADNPGTYLTMIAPYCRTCHIAQDGISFDSEVELDSLRSFVKARVCDKVGVVMPHAQRTYQKFWESGARAAIAVDLGFASCKFKSGF